ncbi:MarR family winged helix-turn-helix transcriptional regulator [Patiriisocius marinus]|uniref:MarR family transcriptional regulator n=1 Tax=Patiriisocius marinus TaxID=1397112 RepID=A0A5J4J6U7_9FLAO|nr:MarR family transcriptional regulator [Patiriisocius marinus]GER60227.1 MarR family transcriptional regulator [Patiriisocius marinus]
MGDLSKDINSEFPNDKIKALLNIMYTASWIQTKQNTFFKPFGISPQQYNILRILRGADEAISVQTIKDRMLERAPNATRLMDKLTNKNFIERVACASDRRVVHIKITHQGQELLSQIDTANRKDLLENLTLKEAAILSDLLDKIR